MCKVPKKLMSQAQSADKINGKVQLWGALSNQMKDTLITLAICIFLTTNPLYAGTYLDSAHGNNSYGVSRTSTSGYTKGNCGHCHEMHASIDGSEPAPIGSAPSKWCVFAINFDTSQTANPYSQDDNFCFYCHTNTGSLQVSGITNNNYSATFGGATATVTGIMQLSLIHISEPTRPY
mgnify:CR=1 FL=1